MRAALKYKLTRYLTKIAQTTGNSDLDQLLKELTDETEPTIKEQDTEPTAIDDATGLKGLQEYEDMLNTHRQALKPAKVPHIEEFEMEDISQPESKPPTLRPGTVHSHSKKTEYEELSPAALKEIEDWGKSS